MEDADSYEVAYWPISDDSVQFSVSVQTNHATLTDLQEATKYKVQVGFLGLLLELGSKYKALFDIILEIMQIGYQIVQCFNRAFIIYGNLYYLFL